jgi:hypothetical protein
MRLVLQPLSASLNTEKVTNLNKSVALVREQTIRQSDHRLSAKLLPTLADRGVPQSQRGTSPMAVFSVCIPEPLLLIKYNYRNTCNYISFKNCLNIYIKNKEV